MNVDDQNIFNVYRGNSFISEAQENMPGRFSAWVKKQAMDKLGGAIGTVNPGFAATQSQKVEDYNEAQRLYLQFTRDVLRHIPKPEGIKIKNWFTRNTTIDPLANEPLKNLDDATPYNAKQIRDAIYQIILFQSQLESGIT